MSKPVRSIADLTISRCSTYTANVSTVRDQVYTGEDLLLKGSIQTNYKKHFITYLKWYLALV